MELSTQGYNQMTDVFNCANCTKGLLYPDGRFRCSQYKCECEFERGIYKLYVKPVVKIAKKINVKEEV